MPDNNRKVIPEGMLKKLNSIYSFKYDDKNDTIEAKVNNYNKTTIHDANKPFIIISKHVKKKITFNIEAITIWKSFSKVKSLSGYSLFDVLNEVNKLKIMYQEPTREKVLDMLKSNFHGIKEI